MNQEQQDALRAPFPNEQIGKLPRVTCKKCRDSNYSECDRHRRQKCNTCGSNISFAHIHLDFVGHADLTDRLLAVDPEWDWEPLAYDEDGLPKFDRLGGMWIKLTVAGVTRKGYGHADGKHGGDAIKEVIGDALRNAGMRFGIALDLWKKEAIIDAFHSPQEPTTPQTNQPTEQPPPQPEEAATPKSDDAGEGAAGKGDLLKKWEQSLERAKSIADPEDRVSKLQQLHTAAADKPGLQEATAFFAAIEKAIHAAHSEQPRTDGSDGDGLTEREWEDRISEAEENDNAKGLQAYMEKLKHDKGEKHRLTGIARAALNRTEQRAQQGAEQPAEQAA